MQNTIDPNLITLISVVAAGSVSVLSIFVPIIVESLKARQARISSEKDKLEAATVELLRELSYLGRPIQGDIERSASRPMQQVFSDLQVKHYVWERAIWNKVSEKNQKNIKALRVKFEKLSSSQKISDISQQLSEITDEILSLTRIASE
jgi:hypothetical protein